MTTAAAARYDLPALVDLLDRETRPARMDRLLGPAAAQVPRHLWERALLGPAREILSRPGKELRARLVEAGWSLGGGDTAAMPPDLPWVVELLHAGSLVVDDIEDDSETRRGGPTLHRAYGMPVALNTGNWLYFLPMTLLEGMPLPLPAVARLYAATARAVLRCHHGQALDLSVRVDSLSPGEVPAVVESIASLKTGSLMGLAAELGAIGAGAPPERVAAISELGTELGISLQMLDDVSGLIVARRAHKGEEDLVHARPTWPWAWLVERAAETRVRRLMALQREVADGRASPAVLRAGLAQEVGGFGVSLARDRLAVASSRLWATLGDHPALDDLSRDARSLFESFLSDG